MGCPGCGKAWEGLSERKTEEEKLIGVTATQSPATLDPAMASYEDREAFIPYRRADLVKMCLEDGKLTPEQGEQFAQFAEILKAYYHFEIHEAVEELKRCYAPVTPDGGFLTKHNLSEEELAEREESLVQRFGKLLERANYTEVTEEELKKALEDETLIDLRTEVDFEDYDRVLFFRRCATSKTVKYKQFGIFQKEKEIDVYDRVVVLLKFKPHEHFEGKKKKKFKKLKDENIVPGKCYLYFYKNIPRYDLELLFPNVRIGMNWKDRVLFGVPALAGIGTVLFKSIPQILIIIGIFLWFMGQQDVAKDLADVDETKAKDFIPVLFAFFTLGVALGGVAVKQYLSYKNKQVKFQLQVVDTLFFKSLDSNAGVFHALADAAEEEETKEIILVYYHLLTSEHPLTAEELDDKVEEWMESHFEAKIDFDIDGPLNNLANLRGKVIRPGDNADDVPEVPLLTRDENGKLSLLSLEESRIFIDYIWDHLFDYNQHLTAVGAVEEEAEAV